MSKRILLGSLVTSLVLATAWLPERVASTAELNVSPNRRDVHIGYCCLDTTRCAWIGITCRHHIRFGSASPQNVDCSTTPIAPLSNPQTSGLPHGVQDRFDPVRVMSLEGERPSCRLVR